MHELTCLSLENDMDLILAYRQGMRLAEIAGLSISKQTSFATAVSEVCRDIILGGKCQGQLRLGVNSLKEPVKTLAAVVTCIKTKEHSAGRQYASKLVDTVTVEEHDDRSDVWMTTKLPAGTIVNEKTLERWEDTLNNDPAISPYEEIKRKNRELQQLADKLKQSERQYQMLTDSLPLMIFTMNTEGDLVYANKWTLDYTGKTMQELNKVRWSNVLHPDEYANAWKEWHQAVANVLPRKTERRLLGQSGEYKWHSGASIPVTSENGDVISYNAFLVDIDAQKKIEQALKDNLELKETKKELEDKVRELAQSNQELEQFAYVASHDLQEPLRKISLYSDYLKSKYTEHIPEEGRFFLDNIGTASARMKQLIHDVLLYSTINDEKGFADVDLDVVMEEAIQDNELTITDKKAVVKYAGLPRIQGIHAQLRQLFENLLSNSLKFTDPLRKPEIDVNGEVAGDYVSITFTDNGIGFEEQYVVKMFDLFQRLHTSEKYKGTGIGLGICKKIVMLHSGTINATGIPGKGATFVIKLPIKQNKR